MRTMYPRPLDDGGIKTSAQALSGQRQKIAADGFEPSTSGL